MNRLTLLVGIAIVVALATWAAPARADSLTLGFEKVETNDEGNPDVSGQVTVDVSYDVDSGKVLFVARNASGVGTYTASICDVYWGPADTALIGTTVTMSSANSSSGVSFSNGAAPATPPGSWSTAAAADSDAPTASNGIGQDEYAGFLIALGAGVTYEQVLGAFRSGDLRMALHIQAIDGDGSDWYTSVTPVPEPASLVLMASALGAGAFVRRRRARATAA